MASSNKIRVFKSVELVSFNNEYSLFNNWRNLRLPLSIEIGCGVGLHPVQWGRANPQKQLLAIERTQVKAQKLLRRLEKNNLNNVFGVHADATQIIPRLIEANTIDEIYILYPNPYPKEKHKNLRFAHSLFTPYLAQLLKANGKLIFATNIEGYAVELKEQIPKRTDLSLDVFKRLEGSDIPRTHFEKKYLARGEHCTEIQFQKVTN